MKEIKIYGRSVGCPFCTNAKELAATPDLFETVEFIEVGKDIEVDDLKKLVMESANVMPKTVPQIFIDGKYVGGFTEMKAYVENKDL